MNKNFKIRGLISNEDMTAQKYTRTLEQFAKTKIGKRAFDDPTLDLDSFGDFHRINSRLGNKEKILRAIHNSDFKEMRKISDFFYNTSGIYSRLCRYMAYLYRYDWVVTPYFEEDTPNAEKIKKTFNQVLRFLDKFNVKLYFDEVALKVIRYGVYYGYKIWSKDGVAIQELPPDYCRSRYKLNNVPIVEFNMKFFDDYFKDPEYRLKMLKTFPKEFQKGYIAYKNGNLPPLFKGDNKGWWVLDAENAFKFNLNGEDFPAFISVIPAIVDLDNAQGIDRKRMEQLILKVLVQKMPIDKNGDMIFDPDEALELHKNAVAMIGRALGLEILTTYADVTVEDMADDNSTTTDELEKVERAVYNEAGVSQMQFNTDGNIALEKSILNDEACMYNLLLQFEIFLNSLMKPFNSKNKKTRYVVQLLPTTIYNYKDMEVKYKELTSLGYSKILPALAMGESQSSILANARFENEILELWKVFIPPLSSNTMNGDALLSLGRGDGGGSDSNNKGGRPEKEDSEKSEKTIQNIESKG